MIRVTGTLRLTRFDTQRIIDRLPRITQAYGTALGTQLQTELQTKQFAWPRATRRRNGQIATSPRDIYDTGELYRSQALTTARNSLTFRWNPTSDKGFPYASLQFTGWVTSRGSVMPGRDWMTPALTNRPMGRFFAEQWRQLGR